MSLSKTSKPKRLKRTQSLCPKCRQMVAAEVIQVDGEVILQRECPQHGKFAAVINSDVKHYHLSIGAEPTKEVGQLEFRPIISSEPEITRQQENGKSELPLLSDKYLGGNMVGCCGGTSAESLSTCVGLIEIVKSCNLECPVCFANSPHPDKIDALEFGEFCSRVGSVIERKGAIDILQLSGGEPTIHPEFFRLLEWSLANKSIGHVLLNTNGVKLTGESFFDQLSELRQRYRKLEIYLQFDGLQSAGQIELRGLDMRKTREQVIRNCESAGVPVNLAMTVDQHNRDHLGDVLRLAIAHPGVSGITFQPMFGSGRAYQGFNQTVQLKPSLPISNSTDSQTKKPPQRRLNVADIIHAAVAQSEGVLKEADFTPLPCGDPNCHTVAYLLRKDDRLLGLSSLVNLKSYQGFLKDRLNYNVSDLLQCGCDSEPLGRMLKQLEIESNSILRIVIKPFMDVWTYDQHRVDRCCVHVIGPGGSLESFCRHYAMA